MAFTKEADFEEAVVKLLIERGWKDGVLKNYTEQQLIQNWANILFENNRGIDRLNDYPLTDGEMQQIMEQVMNAKTPMKLNKFINGKSVHIADVLHHSCQCNRHNGNDRTEAEFRQRSVPENL